MSRPISSAALRDTIMRAFDPVLLPAGFGHVKGLKWVRTRSPDIRDVIEAYGGRRGVRVIRWGVSLDYVPHLVGTELRWHASSQSARIDLGYDPHNFRDEWDFSAQEWTISPDLGFPTPAERAASIARAIPAQAYPWLDVINGLPMLLEAFEREMARQAGQFSFDNYTQHRLAYAVTLARLGQQELAMAEFGRWVTQHRATPEVEANLRAIVASHRVTQA